MKKIYKLLIALLLLTSCSSFQTPETKQQLSGNIKTDVINLLPQGNVIAEIMDGIKQNPRQEELAKRFRESVQKNYEWFVDYMKTVPSGQTMPYHPNLGITEVEYNELQGYLNDIELVSSGTERINITKQGDIIQFKSSGKLAILETVKINLKNNTVTIGEYNLNFSDTANITDETNGLKSKWKGYIWLFEEPSDNNLDALKDLSSLKLKQYKLSIGRLEKNGKTFMTIKGREIENGTKTVNFEIPFIF